jgi:hypothetical protein
LFFASTGHNTIGGYDIFRSEFKQGEMVNSLQRRKTCNTHRKMINFMLYPLTANEVTILSEKKDGMGLQDIYMVEPGLFGKPTALVLVTGYVTYDNAPMKADILVRSKINKKDFSGTFNSNSVNGGYLSESPIW